MKKVKVMLSAILVLAVVAGALAFKANTKSVRVCLYSTEFTADTDDPITSTVCEFITTDEFDITYTNTVEEFARTLDTELPCPNTTECYRATWDIEL